MLIIRDRKANSGVLSFTVLIPHLSHRVEKNQQLKVEHSGRGRKMKYIYNTAFRSWCYNFNIKLFNICPTNGFRQIDFSIE